MPQDNAPSLPRRASRFAFPGGKNRCDAPWQNLADRGVRTVTAFAPMARPVAPVTVAEIELDEPVTVTLLSAAAPGENGRAPHYEVVIVDNDPVTSATAALVAGRPEENLRYAREPRRGLAAAHNALEQRQVLALGPFADGISRLRNRMARYPADTRHPQR